MEIYPQDVAGLAKIVEAFDHLIRDETGVWANHYIPSMSVDIHNIDGYPVGTLVFTSEEDAVRVVLSDGKES